MDQRARLSWGHCSKTKRFQEKMTEDWQEEMEGKNRAGGEGRVGSGLSGFHQLGPPEKKLWRSKKYHEDEYYSNWSKMHIEELKITIWKTSYHNNQRWYRLGGSRLHLGALEAPKHLAISTALEIAKFKDKNKRDINMLNLTRNWRLNSRQTDTDCDCGITLFVITGGLVVEKSRTLEPSGTPRR